MRAAQKQRDYKLPQKNDRRKETLWTKVEDARITAEVRPTDRKLSKALGRSVQAIQQRRSSVLHGHTSARSMPHR